MALLYVNERGTCEERIIQVTQRNWAERPYCAHREREGHFICGNGVRLYARRVEQVTVEHAENGAGVLRWREIDP